MKRFIKKMIPDRVLLYIARLTESILIKGIHSAVREQGLTPVYNQLTDIVPDITHQYSAFDIDSEYLNTVVRAQHSFQISLVNDALLRLENSPEEPLTIVDIGDSAGTHVQYIKELHKNRNIRSLSVNIDSEAIRRIKEKGLEAIQARAEDLASLSIKADIFLCFEMLEHLMNPFEFLKNISQTPCKVFIVTVPYLANSRIGLHHIRHNQKRKVNPETTHIFELSPKDWRLIFKHTGWAIMAEKIFLRYPQKSPFRFWYKNYWRSHDFEGFYGALLTQDDTWSSLYEW